MADGEDAVATGMGDDTWFRSSDLQAAGMSRPVPVDFVDKDARHVQALRVDADRDTAWALVRRGEGQAPAWRRVRLERLIDVETLVA